MSIAGARVRGPAFALVGADRRILRATGAFGQTWEDAEAALEQSTELELVLTGQAERETASIGHASVSIEAVRDAAGSRQALISIAPEEPGSDFEQGQEPEVPMLELQEPLDNSPAAIWLKDLEGRYLYVNNSYVRELGTPEDRLRGHTDNELSPRETVDGPRLTFARDGLDEPQQLEYTVPPFESRAALAAVRFVIRDREGRSVGVCGVAAPLDNAQLARAEADRLMHLERWTRMSQDELRAELLEEWGITPGGAVAGWETATESWQQGDETEPGHESAEWHAEAQAPPAHPEQGSGTEPMQRFNDAVEELQAEAQRWREELEEARSALELVRAEREAREEAERELAEERGRSEELARALADVRARVADLDRALDEALLREDHG